MPNSFLRIPRVNNQYTLGDSGTVVRLDLIGFDKIQITRYGTVHPCPQSCLKPISFQPFTHTSRAEGTRACCLPSWLFYRNSATSSTLWTSTGKTKLTSRKVALPNSQCTVQNMTEHSEVSRRQLLSTWRVYLVWSNNFCKGCCILYSCKQGTQRHNHECISRVLKLQKARLRIYFYSGCLKEQLCQLA